MRHRILCRTTYHHRVGGPKSTYFATSYAIDCSCGNWTGFWSEPDYALWNWKAHIVWKREGL